MMAKIIQYIHRPNLTELGMGNTHDRYLVGQEEILKQFFPLGENVKVYDDFFKKNYIIYSKFENDEFRVKQMGNIYDDYQMEPGDEVIFTRYESNDSIKTTLQIIECGRVFLNPGKRDRGIIKDFEIVNIQRLSGLNKTSKYSCKYKLFGEEHQIEIGFSETRKKRTDSPTDTDFYEVKYDGKELESKSSPNYYLTIRNNAAILKSLPKYEYKIILDSVVGGSELMIDSNEPLQQIFYGAPGTGKSHVIKRLTKDKSVIRTTFHPDSDYSTFVGCYKPTMKVREDNLSIVELTAKLKEIAMAVPPVSYPCLNFATRYWKSLLKLTPKERENIIVACGFGTSYTAEVHKGMSIGSELAGYFKDESIVYRFVKQAFLKAYLLAWKKYVNWSSAAATTTAAVIHKTPGESQLQENPNLNKEPLETETTQINIDPQFLIIEEINRGNCAQIFGDLFQLLDRQDNGFSEYPIEADTDLQQEIERAFNELGEYHLESKINVDSVIDDYTSNYGASLSDDIQHGRILLLPSNLYIWATMNTSDQSLFPIDSAFKRRWEWKYIPISYKNEDWVIEIGDKTYKWVDFQCEINNRIYSIDNSEDKQLGDFFVDANRTGKIISADTLLNKILFYIWNDVCKDDPDQIFRWIDYKDKKEKSIRFSDFFTDDKDKKLQGLMSFLGVKAEGEADEVTPVISTGAEESEVVPEEVEGE